MTSKDWQDRAGGAVALLSDPAIIKTCEALPAQFVAQLADAGCEALVSNIRSRAMLLQTGDFNIPITCETGEYGQSYVVSPHSTYVLYARDELDILKVYWGRWIAKSVLLLTDGLLRGVRLNKTVHIDNWLLSTNLHGRWRGQGLARIREALADNFSDHFLICRSLDSFSSPDLLEAFRKDGWTLIPSRQIWVTDDLEAQWKTRSHTKSDLRALRKSGLQIEEPAHLSSADCERIAALYHQLYVGRYTALNPLYTPEFVDFSARSGLLKFRVARGPNGAIMAFAGMRIAANIVSVPMLGYDTSRPQAEALYRIASLLSAQWALDNGCQHHGSSGAGTFKQNRGARSLIEYMAVDARHLSPVRQAGLNTFAAGLTRLMEPLLARTQH